MANYAEKPQMGFIEACKTACQKMVTFKGRARRSEFWWAILGMTIVSLLITPVEYLGMTGCIVYYLLSLAIAIMSFSLTFRRLHDTGRSGWFAGLPSIICLVGITLIIIGCLNTGISFSELTETSDTLTEEIIDNMTNKSSMNAIIGTLMILASGVFNIVVFIFCCMDSKPGTNKYGESPKYIEEA